MLKKAHSDFKPSRRFFNSCSSWRSRSCHREYWTDNGIKSSFMTGSSGKIYKFSEF